MKILIIDDNLINLQRFITKLQEEHDVTEFDRFEDIKNIKDYNFDIAFIDLDLSGSTNTEKRNTEGFDVAEFLHKKNTTIIKILLTGEQPNLEEVFKNNYIDEYFDKAWRNNSLLVDALLRRWSRFINKINENKKLKLENEELLTENIDFASKKLENIEIAKEVGIIYSSNAIDVVIEKIKRICKKVEEPYNILLMGDSGTGKELFSDLITKLSGRDKMIKENLSGFKGKDPSMLHSEIFGHVKGSFTGAQKDKKGLVHEAENQILFLDELHNTGLDFQNTLLRLLENNEFRKLGSTEYESSNIIFIGGINEDKDELMKNGKLKPDLYYRFPHTIQIPTLKERSIEDFTLLVKYFLSKEKENYRITDETINHLFTFDFKGNIRELNNCLQSTILMMDGYTITIDDLVIDSNKKIDIQLPILSSNDDYTTEIKLLENIEKVVIKLKNENKKITLTEVGRVLKIDNIASKFSEKVNKKMHNKFKYLLQNNKAQCNISKSSLSTFKRILRER